jgi:hypothetical protein
VSARETPPELGSRAGLSFILGGMGRHVFRELAPILYPACIFGAVLAGAFVDWRLLGLLGVAFLIAVVDNRLRARAREAARRRWETYEPESHKESEPTRDVAKWREERERLVGRAAVRTSSRLSLTERRLRQPMRTRVSGRVRARG